jgi:flagellar hook-basal body complex protein FliE
MTPLIAARAYGQAIKQSETLGKGAAAGGADFGAMLRGAMENTVQTTQNAEHMMTQQASGKAELIDAVTAVANAETSLQSVIAIRDQVISAYQEIMRMSI